MRAAIAAAVLVCATSALAQPSEAERLYHDGQRAYDAGRYDDAVAAWDKSYALSRLPALLFNIGQAYRLRAWSGDCTRAADAYRKFIAVEPRSPQRGQVEGFLAELGPCVDAERGAQPAQPQPRPAPHVDDPGRGKRLIAYGSGATGALLVGIGVYYGHRAATLSDEVTSACRAGCTFADVAAKDAEGRSADRKQYVFYGLGAAALVTGGVLYWMAGREHTSAVVALDARSAFVGIAGRF
jgi:tetratricopeptide (TPR) repeat protein